MSSRVPFDAGNYVDAALSALGLDVASEWKAGIVTNFSAIAGLAEDFLDFPLADEDEPAPIFIP
jgi:hypothetical protein